MSNQSRQIDKNLTKQVRIENGLHYLLKIRATESGMSIKTLIEGYVSEGLNKDKDISNA